MGFKRFQCQWIYRNYTMTNLPEPNFIERDAEKITAEWIALSVQTVTNYLSATYTKLRWFNGNCKAIRG